MSVESEILRIQQNIANAYSAVSGKGGQVPLQPTSENLAGAINTIPSGGGSSGGNPVGTVISFMGTSAPAGYLACDGAVYNISEYAALAALFQTQFGSSSYFGGNGSTTFAVPDMRNLFLRGYHGGAAALSGNIGKKQAATEIPGFATFYNPSDGWSGIFSGASHKEPGISTFNIDGADTQTSVKPALYTGVSENGVEEKIASTYTARPVNMAVLYCIKAS